MNCWRCNGPQKKMWSYSSTIGQDWCPKENGVDTTSIKKDRPNDKRLYLKCFCFRKDSD